MIRLNLGSGDDYMPGWTNVDLYSAKADERYDISKLPYADNSVDEIKVFHIIEHFPWFEANNALREWRRVLKPGGRLWLETPDMLESFREYVNADQNYRYALNGHIFSEAGGSPGQTHYFLLAETDLFKILKEAGFSSAKRIQPSSTYLSHFPPHIFLCVEAFK